MLPSPHPAAALTLLDALPDPLITVDGAGRVVTVNQAGAKLLGEASAALVHRPLLDVLLAAGLVFLRPDGAATGQPLPPEFELRDRAAQRWWSGRTFPHGDGLAVQLQDITERRRARGRREALLSVTLALGGTTTGEEVVRAALQVALPAVGAAAGAVLRLTPDGEALEIMGAQGYPGDVLARWKRIGLDHPFPALEAWRRQTPVYLRIADQPAPFPVPPEDRRPTTRALAALPLRSEGAMVGVLALSFDFEPTFNESERDFLELLAGQVAQALGRAQWLGEREGLARQRERALNELTRERARLAAILDQMPVALWVAELPGGRLIGGNAAIDRELGLSFLPAESTEEYAVYTGFHPDGRPYAAHEWPMARTLRTGEAVTGEEIEMERKDGTRLRARFSTAIIHDADGTPALAVVSGTDITQLHDLNVRLEALVEHRTAALDAFVQFTEAAATTTDGLTLAGVAVGVLRAALGEVSVAYYLRSGDLWQARVLSDDFAPEVAAALRAGVSVDSPSYAQAARSGEPVFVAGWDAAAQGVAVTESYSAGAFFPCVVAGQTVGLLAVGSQQAQAFTERECGVIRAVGRSLTLALDRAEQAGALRSQRDALDERARALSAANEQLDAFALSVSHDLRTPVRHILGFTELLSRNLGGSLDGRDRRHLGVIGEAAGRMNALIDALLAFSRTARHPLTRQAVNLGALVASVQAEVSQDQTGQAAQWLIGDLPTVPGDAALLRQVLVNLLGNALKYSRTRAPARIEVWAERQPEHWLIGVRDNGVGFDPQYGGRLFGVFQRLHPESEFEGIGVGLANVRRIVERHGGEVWAQGVPGEGATLRFTLPRT
ncbi:GAF domain-containing protein [Deinococcus koreensis]|uniref:histidine kinase n=1 Tax=Deinococcus koreensis TaxID=2054903 RepID=A0A2K3US70_9DEIO|nr:GAF domain-containing protein [Deinococcus koreensis]PNY79385.1 hypothetical protein CVO96_19885 [Deinococcus koreensis]